ncbi:MAG: RsmB/NOP family class I SAM-dependent RNA methyltransferase [Paracoccaceae bacterium]|nr:RsmB/NOP family class I SAM-dependent RNA methyltransferase [Paracoccaceae bacterium]
MTPSARVAAAIECLDAILVGGAAEKVLTTWARTHRFAGSKDRAAIRDHVFGALRCRRSYAAIGGAETGRGIMIGACLDTGGDSDAWFDGKGYGAAILTQDEQDGTGTFASQDRSVQMDVQDWMVEQFDTSLGAQATDIALKLRERAPVFVRVNLRLGTVDDAVVQLGLDDIEVVRHPDVATALEVTKNPRRVQLSSAYLGGLIELQDAASQAVVAAIPLPEQGRILDYCAGGGGKSLAMAALTKAEIFAHDSAPERMKDLWTRADRAGVNIANFDTNNAPQGADFNVVLCDAPCSGSGAWRRAPAGKWAFTPEDLSALCQTQAGILDDAKKWVMPGGLLAYATCSLFAVENADQVDAFLGKNPSWTCESQIQFTPLDHGDGFFVALLRAPA